MNARLARTVRLGLRDLDPAAALATPRGNTHVGWPSLDTGLGASWTVTVEVSGRPDPRTGYLVGIDRIDAAVRSEGLPRMIEARPHERSAPALTRRLLETVDATMDVDVTAVELRIEPLTAWRIESSSMSTPIVKRRYEFSASHRLHLPELDDDANRELFGKCSNPHGHGHNYEVEVEVAFEGDPLDGGIHRLDEVVDAVVIDRFDHKHLNLDLEDFRDRVASVENIAARCVDLLRDPVTEIAAGARLHAVTVWETPRTACTIHA